MNNSDIYNYKAEVVRIVDGDTVILDIDAGFMMWLRGERARLADIDAPETWGGVEPGGKEATIWLKTRLAQCGNLVFIKTQKSPDKFGRWLVTLFDPQTDENINEQMVELGLAKRYVP